MKAENLLEVLFYSSGKDDKRFSQFIDCFQVLFGSNNNKIFEDYSTLRSMVQISYSTRTYQSGYYSSDGHGRYRDSKGWDFQQKYTWTESVTPTERTRAEKIKKILDKFNIHFTKFHSIKRLWRAKLLYFKHSKR